MLTIPPIGLTRRKVAAFSPPDFVSIAFATVNSSNFIHTVNKPAGTVEDDVMIFFYFSAGAPAGQIASRPSGWVNKHAGTQFLEGSDSFQDCDVKIATGSEPASYTWQSQGGAASAVCAILTYRPASGTQLDVIAGGIMANPGFSHTANNVTTNFDNSMIVAAYMLNGQGGNDPNPASAITGMTSRLSQNGGGIGRQDLELAIFDELKGTAGLYSGRSLPTSTQTYSYGITAAIRATS